MKIFFFVLLLLFCNRATAQYFKGSSSLVGVANFAGYHFIEREGDFFEDKGNLNLGFGGDLAYYFNAGKRLFVKTGVRLLQLKSGL